MGRTINRMRFNATPSGKEGTSALPPSFDHLVGAVRSKGVAQPSMLAS